MKFCCLNGIEYFCDLKNGQIIADPKYLNIYCQNRYGQTVKYAKLAKVKPVQKLKVFLQNGIIKAEITDYDSILNDIITVNFYSKNSFFDCHDYEPSIIITSILKNKELFDFLKKQGYQYVPELQENEITPSHQKYLIKKYADEIKCYSNEKKQQNVQPFNASLFYNIDSHNSETKETDMQYHVDSYAVESPTEIDLPPLNLSPLNSQNSNLQHFNAQNSNLSPLNAQNSNSNSETNFMQNWSKRFEKNRQMVI